MQGGRPPGTPAARARTTRERGDSDVAGAVMTADPCHQRDCPAASAAVLEAYASP